MKRQKRIARLVIKDNVEFGTRKNVTVATIVRRSTAEGMVVFADGEAEPYLLLSPVGSFDAKSGDTGTITFTQGGPTGGYWQFARNPVAKPA